MTLRAGMKGNEVGTLQAQMTALGFFHSKVDGDFGPLTRAAVQAAQRSIGLPVTGVADPKTLWAIRVRAAAKCGPAEAISKAAPIAPVTVTALTSQPAADTARRANATSLLIPASPRWRGTVGRGLTRAEFAAHVEGLRFGAWRPSFIVLHNTGSPNMAQWDGHDVVDRLKNLTAHYRDDQGWRAGPHLFVDHTYIWLFTPLTVQGTHSPSWNSISWGIEMVGDYDSEPFDSGKGAMVRDNAVFAMAVLCNAIGADPSTFKLHKEDKRTTNACPGRHVDKADVLARLEATAAELSLGDHQAGRAA